MSVLVLTPGQLNKLEALAVEALQHTQADSRVHPRARYFDNYASDIADILDVLRASKGTK